MVKIKNVNGPRPVHLANLKIINDNFLLDICSGKFHRISESAAYIINELKKQTPIKTIIVNYSQRYSVPRTIAERDVELFLNDILVIQ